MYRANATFMILKGQKTVEVRESQLLAKKKVLEEGELHCPNKVIKNLEEMHCKAEKIRKRQGNNG